MYKRQPPYYASAYYDTPYRRADVGYGSSGGYGSQGGYGSPGGYYGSFSGYGHGHHDSHHCCKKGKGFFGFDNNFLTYLIGGILFMTVFNDFLERLLNRDLNGNNMIGSRRRRKRRGFNSEGDFLGGSVVSGKD